MPEVEGRQARVVDVSVEGGGDEAGHMGGDCCIYEVCLFRQPVKGS